MCNNLFVYVFFQEGITSGPRLSLHARAPICGREIRIQMVESPRRDQLIPAIMVILLFDLTNKVCGTKPWDVGVGWGMIDGVCLRVLAHRKYRRPCSRPHLIDHIFGAE